MRARNILIPGLVLAFTGCVSMTNLKTARSINPGQVQATTAVSFIGASNNTTPGNLATTTHEGNGPDVEVMARVGVVKNLDLGVKIGTQGVALQSTISLVRGPFLINTDNMLDEKSSIDLAFAPSIGFYGFYHIAPNVADPVTIGPKDFAITLPLLIGFNAFGGNQFIIGPTFIPIYGKNVVLNGYTHPTVFALLSGATMGISFRLSEVVRIMPEVGIFYGAGWDLTHGYELQTGTATYQFNLGMSFGGDGFGGTTESRVMNDD
jgi:hypothetical protein